MEKIAVGYSGGRSRSGVRWSAIAGFALGSLLVAGCRGERQDTLLTWAENPSHQWRAAVVQRQYFMDGRVDKAPTMYVLVEPADGPPKYTNGQDFERSAIVMKPTRCGPLSVEWTSDLALEVKCDQCGLALAEAGKHVGAVGPVKVEYAGFPEQSSWEASAGQ